MRSFLPFILLLLIAAALIAGCSSSSTSPATVNGPITRTVFPAVVGHAYVFTGFATATDSVGGVLPDPLNGFRTSWTIATAVPVDTTIVFTVVDSSNIPALSPPAKVDTLTFVRDTIRGNISLVVSLGPVLRQYGLGYIADTNHLIQIARPSTGLGGTWIGFDSSFTDTSGVAFELRYNGTVADTERIMDSTAAHTVHYVYRFRVEQNVIIGGVIFASSVYSEIWLEAKTGPIEALFAQNNENPGRFLVLSSRNF